MKKKLTTLVIIGVLITMATTNSFTYSYVPPANYVNIGSSNCTSCHSGTNLNKGGGHVVVTISGQSKPYYYQLDSWYTINVAVNDSKAYRYGFESAVVDNTTKYKQIGTDSAYQSNTYLTTTKARNYVSHYGADSTHTWSYLWKAPHTGTGIVRIYTTGNGADGDGSSAGDHIYAAIDTLSYKKTTTDVYNLAVTEPILYYFNNKIHIQLPANYAAGNTLYIYDINGRCLSNALITPGMEWSVSELPAGVYIATIINSNGVAVAKKFIKN